MGSQAHGHQPPQPSQSKKKTKKSSKQPQSTSIHDATRAHGSSQSHEGEDEEWCFLPTPAPGTTHHRVTVASHRQSDRQLQGADQELSQDNLALLDIMNRTCHVNARLLCRQGRPKHGSNNTRHRPASRRSSNGSIDLDVAWSPVAGALNAYDDSDMFAIGAWTQSNTAPMERATRPKGRL